MTEYELHSLINDLFRDMDSMIEFWLSATFAVIVARFVAKGVLSLSVRCVMAALYLVATFLSMTRYGLAAGRTGVYKARLLTMGVEEFFQPQDMMQAMNFLFWTIYGGGTLATLYFLFRRDSRGKAEQSALS